MSVSTWVVISLNSSDSILNIMHVLSKTFSLLNEVLEDPFLPFHNFFKISKYPFKKKKKNVAENVLIFLSEAYRYINHLSPRWY